MDVLGLWIIGLLVIVAALAPLYGLVRRGTLISVFGVLLILLAPVLCFVITNAPTTFDVWLGTFCLLGACVFAWGMVENVIAAIRPPRDEPK